jgi:hypothetical protein
MLDGARGGVQLTLDHLVDRLGLLDTTITAGAYTHARNKLHAGSFVRLNDALIEQCQSLGFIQKYKGLRIVSGDASDVYFGHRVSCSRIKCAPKHFKLFMMHLPGSELILHGQLYHPTVDERQMLSEHLERLGPDDVLVLDRGYPAAWLIHMLDQRGIKFVIRCDACGFDAVGQFLSQNQCNDIQTSLNVPDAQQAQLYEVPRTAPKVRMVKHQSSKIRRRVFITNLDVNLFSVEDVADIYHQRWRIEEAFKRLKTKALLESPGAMTEHAIRLEVGARLVADNLNNLAAASIIAVDPSRTAQSKGLQISRSAAYSLTHQTLFVVLSAPAKILMDAVDGLIHRLKEFKVRITPNRSTPRPANRKKSHPSMCYRRV